MRALRQRYLPLPAILFGVVLIVSTNVARSDSDLERALRQYNFESVKGYVQPISDLFGTDVNSGFYHSAAIPRSGFHLEFDIVAMGALVSDDQKAYEVKLPAGFTPKPGSTLKTATVFGGKGTLFEDYHNGQLSGLQYKGSDGIINTSIFPLGVPQLTIGSVYGTEATIRFVTSPEIGSGKFPKTTLFGIGGRHSISQYIPNFPLDLAAGVFYSSFTVGDLITSNSIAFGVQASKEFSVLVLYGGLQYEKSSLNLKFTSSDPTASPLVDVTLDGANTFRGTVGVGLALGVFNIFADANLGQITGFSGGIGFGF